MTKTREKRTCKVCKKEIEVIHKSIGRGGNRKGSRTCNSYSDEGVPFNYNHYNVWFCNDCWEKMFRHWELMRK